MCSLVSKSISAARDGYTGDELLGECPFNARRLHDELQARGIQCNIIRGGFEIPDKGVRPSSMEEAVQAGNVHWWVEAYVTGSWFTIDIASEVPGQKGESIFTQERPAAYIPFEINPTDTEMFASR